MSGTSPAGVVTRLRAAGCVFAEEEAQLLLEGAGSAAELAAMVDRRVAGEPLEQVLGWAEFCGQRFVVEPGVFVPRRRTGVLVREAAALARPGAVLLDLCCGTGAVGAATAAAVPGIEVHAADVDPAAARCARVNLARLGGRVHEGDLYDALPAALRGRVDMVVANAPYVPTGEIALMPPEARDHELRTALDGGVDGLDLQRQVIAGAPHWLVPGGSLLVETSERQAPETLAVMSQAGLAARVVVDEDLAGTVVVGQRPPCRGTGPERRTAPSW
jgi:release factor glutamine methyltransferase